MSSVTAGTRPAVPAPTGRRARRRGERGVSASILLHGTLLLAVGISVFPIIWLVLTSLKPRDGWLSSELELFNQPSLDNYVRVLTGTQFPTWLLNSVIVAGLTTVLGVFLASTTGYAISRFRFPGYRGVMWMLLITQMFPVAILIVPLYNLMAGLGLLNQVPGLVIAYMTVAVPFCAWMMKSYFDSIPREIDQAGLVDGLTPFGTFWRLILPLARPSLAVTAFYSFMTAWGEVAYATVFMSQEEKRTLGVGLQQFVGQHWSDWGLLTASAVLIAVPAAIVFLLVQRHLVTGLTAGATKS
ncbi:arabinogalactan oligomer/maltooligosaccharide transport system permease protein [Streptosporangium becharense]|uniref:Arabinogalactan oligomer/maltooligosaccharide transport system permease protein n=1 Tax=Streptosporangium becharense TaxID=1816182 RepID=A0A7W9ILE7_9ACTN|nr:carbohydrate ABC transporter permease [Streptosporangium becharense]MBB2910161.1 arabinogalactan oligomer/maltooligosaccharide transport system permease protein [Streptosporangium becharense]MBB5822904.1 arabinogalactan oligomer/maltooligosaccharide transport system permease protein [Streptosporangium becharense]